MYAFKMSSLDISVAEHVRVKRPLYGMRCEVEGVKPITSTISIST